MFKMSVKDCEECCDIIFLTVVVIYETEIEK